MIVSDHNNSCWGTNVPGHKCVWAQSCLGTIVSGHSRVWAQSCLGTVVSGHSRVWAQSCGPNRVGPIMYGHNRGGTNICLIDFFTRNRQPCHPRTFLESNTLKKIDASPITFL